MMKLTITYTSDECVYLHAPRISNKFVELDRTDSAVLLKVRNYITDS